MNMLVQTNFKVLESKIFQDQAQEPLNVYLKKTKSDSMEFIRLAL